MSIRVLIAGGGTSGHIYPAISIADRLRREDPDSAIEFCGTSAGPESEIVPKAGYIIHPIRASGFPSRPSIKLFRALSDFFAGKKTCLGIIDDFQPDVVIGTGGYVCSPLISAAHTRKIPIILHEQNAFPGRANRTLSRYANVVCTGFPDMDLFFPKCKQVICTGNPIREVFVIINRQEARNHLNILDSEFFVLAMGGSLGSKTINDSVLSVADILSEGNTRFVLSAGRQQYRLISEIGSAPRGNLEIYEYILNTHLYMAAADLIVCRAGAITCAEIAAVGTPSIMIPYPYAAGDHQTYNAKAFENNDASILIRDSDVTPEKLSEIIRMLSKDKDRCKGMSAKAKELFFPGSDQRIAEVVFALCENNRKSGRSRKK